MTKLKCWKKTSKDYWKNTKDSKQIVEIKPWNKSYIITNEKGFNAEGLIEIKSSRIKAEKSAKEYMKEHDKC